ncbi:MAG: exodeoxyribonuclease VII small subunit [Myxococcota bacterium]
MSNPHDAGTAPDGAGAPDDLSELEFEGALDSLENVVDRLEAGELSLEEALATYERGVALSRRCEALLSRAERRIDELVTSAEGSELRPFDAEEEEDETA